LSPIPVELYSAIEDHNVRFHLLHKKCGSRVRNQLFCPVCKVVIERDETVRGYEVTKGQHVKVEDAELEALEAEANSSIEMREFIPIEKVDPIYFESTYYLAPDKGADKPYRLLADTMAKTGRVALAQTVFHNKGEPGFDPLGKARPDSALSVFQKRDPRLRRDSERRRHQAPRRAAGTWDEPDRENVFG
jgi:DNA end-binding protein Ku